MKLNEIQKTCAVCGYSSAQKKAVAATASGVPDLDMRPPGNMRLTIGERVQRCPHCGYCSPDIAQKKGPINDFIHSEFYQNQLYNEKFPDLTNHFLCWAFIEESLRDFANGGWAALHAAWVCDDLDNKKASKVCRKKAAKLFIKARKRGQTFAEEGEIEDTILVDLLRRSGQFEQAFEICDKRLDQEPKQIIADILYYEKILIRKEDINCYTVGDARDAMAM